MTVAETPTDTATAITRRLRPRPRPHEIIRRHPLPAFFVLANLLSWIAWTPYVLSETALGVLPVTLNSIVGVLPGAYLGPIFSAFLVTAVTEGRAGIRSWVRRLLRWRVPGRWYAVALLGVPGGMLLTGLAFSGGEIHAPSLMALSMYVPLLLFQFVTTGLAEEPGWRDFALPRLQDRFSPLVASMILGPIWALWHFPLFFTEWGGYPDASWTRATSFLLFCLGFNLVMTWIFNRTGQSLPLAILAHVSVNTFASLMWDEMFPGIDGDGWMYALAVGALVAGAAVAVLTRGRLGYRGPLGYPGRLGR
ncbi:type II CAAX endopeptidase family protein [Dietzia lutea]|uniref:type II CAAX endopeptidase family protein n=1 Tax=Dietzia lutea TaxID=546160 RepID=UPI000D55BF1D|nr:type II CAAX endopeptidase family protein [Dietzia lutea]